MKKIENRLILTNLFVVILSLLAFFVVVTINFNRYYTANIYEQLRNENNVAMRTIDAIESQPGRLNFKILANSETLIYRDGKNGFKRLFAANSLVIVDEYLEEILETEEGKISSVLINGQKYFFIYQLDVFKVSQNVNTDSTLLVLTVISDDNISFINSSNLKLLIVSMIVLSIIAIIVSVYFAKKITKPIVKLTKISKNYSQRKFDEKIEVNSNDEIGDLAISMNEMATSLIEYEREQTKFYRDLSHEIKTPLTSIYGYAEGLKQGIFNDVDKPSKIIMDESLRIKEMLEDIILLNKLDSKIEKFDFKKHDLSNSIVKAIEKIEAVAILNDIEIIFKPTDITIKYDEDKIIRALLNLLSNALKHTKDTVKIEVVVTDVVEVRVSDNGSGFSENSLMNLNDNQLRDSALGNGLGLLIVKRIVGQHNGRIECSNTPSGALVIIRLPFN